MFKDSASGKAVKQRSTSASRRMKGVARGKFAHGRPKVHNIQEHKVKARVQNEGRGFSFSHVHGW